MEKARKETKQGKQQPKTQHGKLLQKFNRKTSNVQFIILHKKEIKSKPMKTIKNTAFIKVIVFFSKQTLLIQHYSQSPEGQGFCACFPSIYSVLASLKNEIS